MRLKRWLGLVAVLGALVAVSVAPASSSASNCQISVSPAIESALFGGPEVFAQVTFYNCVDVHQIKVRYQYNGTLSVTSGADNYNAGSNVKPFHVYQGINACGSNGLKPVPPPPPANAGTDFVCSASGTICGSLAAGCSMWGYSAAGLWWSGCRQIVASFRVALKSYAAGEFAPFGPLGTYGNVATLCS